MWKNRHVHRSFQYMQVRKGTGGKKVQPSLGESGNEVALELGIGKAARGIILNAGRLYMEVPSNKREAREEETKACRVETEKIYSKSFKKLE